MSFDDPFNSNNQFDQNTTDNFYNYGGEDPAADFLERERQELGDITGNADINSFDDPFNSNNAQMSNGTYSPLSNEFGKNNQMSSNIRSSPYEALSDYNEQINEPEKIQKWREEFSARIQKKDVDEEVKCKEMREQAKKELDDFYKQRIEQLERNKEQNRINNRALEEEIISNTSETPSNGKVYDWDKITGLCEFNPKNNRSQKDLTRYRGVLLQLKQQQLNGK